METIDCSLHQGTYAPQRGTEKGPVLNFCFSGLLLFMGVFIFSGTGMCATYSITESAGTGGNLSCIPNPVEQDSASVCTITPDVGYVIGTVSGCGTGSRVGNLYTTGTITADCTVSVTFDYYGLFEDSGQSLGTGNSQAVVLGDVDGDGDLDVFFANNGQGNEVWLNDGAGIFTDSGQSLGSYNSSGVVLGKLDGDDDLDAFVSNADGHDSRVWMNDGAGNFTDSGQIYDGSNNSRDIDIGDLDGDSDLDAYISNYDGESSIWLNDGSGTFIFNGLVPSTSGVASALGKLDADGDLDAFVTNYSNNSQIMLNGGLGDFTDSGQSLYEGDVAFTTDVALGDLNGDGYLDAFVADDEYNSVWINDGTGTFIEEILGPIEIESEGVALGDLDDDGDLDAFVADDYNANEILLNDGTGTFDLEQTLGKSHSMDVALGDLDGDGDLDAVVANRSGEGNRVWINRFSESQAGAEMFNIGVSLTGNGSGTVTSVPVGIDCGDDCSSKYFTATALTLTATPDARREFVGWSGDCIGTGECVLDVSSAKTVTAEFVITSYLLTETAGTGGTVSCSPNPVVPGSTTACTINPSLGYHIDTVTGCGGMLNVHTYTTAAMAADCTVNVTFALNSHTLDVSGTGTGTGLITADTGVIDCGAICSDTFIYGTAVTLTAIPDINNTFTGWSLTGGDGYVREWTAQRGTSQNDSAYATATDAAGNIYVSGYTYGSMDGNSNTGNADLIVVKYDASGVWQWTRQIGTTDPAYPLEIGYGLAADGGGNVYVVGMVQGSIDGNFYAGLYDIFVVKYDTDGVKKWSRQLGTSDTEIAYDVALDGGDNVYVTGYTRAALDGNTSDGGWDMFLVKYDSSGTKQWTRQLGSATDDEGRAVATDAAGNVYVAGKTYGDFDGHPSAGGNDLFVVKYDSSGAKLWSEQLGSPDKDEAGGMAVDATGNIYLTGWTDGELDGNTNVGDEDIFLVKYDTDGTRQWTSQMGSTGRDSGDDVVLDSTGNLYIAGHTDSGLNGNTGAGSWDLIVQKYDTAGALQWTRQMGSVDDDGARSIAIDAAGNLYAAGWTNGDLDGSTNAGGYDLILTKFSQGCTGTGTCSFIMDADLTVTATFVMDTVCDLKDAVLVLQVLTNIPMAEAVCQQADVNDDDKIGLEELIFILQDVSGIHAQ